MDAEEEILRNFMIKRSTLKKKKLFHVDNYRSRWFILYSSRIAYYEGSLEGGPGKECNSFLIETIKCVEEASINKIDADRKHGFQIWYHTNGISSINKLYIDAQTSTMRDEWIHKVREMCKMIGNSFLPKYHPDIWLNKSGFGCCKQIDQDALGCAAAYNSPIPRLHKSPSCSSTGSLERSPTPNQSPRLPSKSPIFGRKSPNLNRKSPKTERRSPKLTTGLYPDGNLTNRKKVNGVMSNDSLLTNGSSPNPANQGRPSPGANALEQRKNKPLPIFPPQQLPNNNLIDLGSPQETPRQAPSVPMRPQPAEPAAKRVVALYDYHATNPEDLNMNKGDVLEIVNDEKEPHWWEARHVKDGCVGWIPSNYVKGEKRRASLTDYNWYYPQLTRRQAEQILRNDPRDGVYLVRPSRKSGEQETYVMSLHSNGGGGKSEPQVKHYHIKIIPDTGEYYFSVAHPQKSIPQLVEYHMVNGAGLVSRLRFYPNEEQAPPTMGLRKGQKVIQYGELDFQARLGRGNFGEVWRALYRGSKDVAVKKSLPSMNDQEFRDEAKVMMNLQHKHLVQLYGLVETPQLMIVTEFMQEGALTDYLKKHKDQLPNDQLVHMGIQVALAMEYLDRESHIHRDLAARNCLVGANQVVKVADFGLSRHVLDDIYTSTTSRFPIRWVAPEVLCYARFSSKSDVWSFGVLMWEIFSYADIPYASFTKNELVVKFVAQSKGILSKPRQCPNMIYEVIQACMSFEDTARPHFPRVRSWLEELHRKMLDYPG